MTLLEITSGQADSTPGIEMRVAHHLGAIPEFVYVTPRQNAKIWLTSKSASDVGITSDTTKAICDIKVLVDHSLIK